MSRVQNFARTESEPGDSLPADRVPVTPFAGGAHQIPNAPLRAMERADSKTEIVLNFRTFRQNAGGTLRAALRAFVAFYNANQIEVSPETRAEYPRLAIPSLQRDWRKFERGGPSALVRKDPGHRGDTIIARTPGMRDFILSMIAHQPHVRVARIHEALACRFLRVPSIARVRNFVAQWKQENPALMMRLRDPDDYKRKFTVALGDAAANITRTNQRWEADGTKLEVQCLDGLFHLNASIDIRSRRAVILLTPTASAEATAQLLRKAIPILGVPELIVTDWGKEYRNHRLGRAMLRLGIGWQKVAKPYSGELKPFIERFQGTILHDFFEGCPGYKGHNVKQAAEIRARNSFQARRGERRNIVKLYDVQLTSAELQELADRWLSAVYENRPHAGLHGATPAAVFAEGDARGEVRRVPEESALDLLLGEDGVAVVGTKGIRVSGGQFWDDALIEWRGRKIQFVHTRDAGKIVVYSNLDTPTFICIAIDVNAEGIDRQVVSLAATEREKEWMREEMAKIRRMKREHRPENLQREVIEHAEARAAATLAPETNIAAMPYRSAGLREAATALAALEAKPSAPMEHSDRAQIDSEFEEIARENTRELYDEAADAAATVERYSRLRELPRARWSAADTEFMEMASELPEIRALKRCA